MDLFEINESNKPVLYDLLTEYYRSAEDADTPISEIDDFIAFLFGMIIDGSIEGRIAQQDGVTAGFVLWGIDREGWTFSEMLGLGTILEIGVVPAWRNKGNGRELAGYAEDAARRMGIKQMYISAYGPAQQFWLKCGYEDVGRMAKNGLPIMIKQLTD
ncbi:MAG: GNAT family N-acetyltransferase [Eubacteriales bacterium]|nr:GNAT family N-acetyltransferase [Eubacteriales bacterium]